MLTTNGGRHDVPSCPLQLSFNQKHRKIGDERQILSNTNTIFTNRIMAHSPQLPLSN